MAKILFLNPYYSDRATLSGGSWGMSLSLLQDMQPSYEVQSVGVTTTATKIKIDFGSPVLCDALALGRVLAPADGTMTVNFATSEGGLASPAYSTGSISMWPATGKPTDRGIVYYDVFKKLSPGGAYRWVEIDFDVHNSTDGYMSIGRFYMGPCWTPQLNVSYDFVPGRVSNDTRIKTSNGHTLTAKKDSPRVWDVPFKFMTRTDAENTLYEMERELGTAGDLFVVLDPDETTRLHRVMMMATFDAMPDPARRYVSRYQTSFKLLELR